MLLPQTEKGTDGEGRWARLGMPGAQPLVLIGASGSAYREHEEGTQCSLPEEAHGKGCRVGPASPQYLKSTVKTDHKKSKPSSSCFESLLRWPTTGSLAMTCIVRAV